MPVAMLLSLPEGHSVKKLDKLHTLVKFVPGAITKFWRTWRRILSGGKKQSVSS